MSKDFNRSGRLTRDSLIRSPLRILIHHRVASRDGQSVHLEELIKALIDCGHEVKLVGPSRFQNTAFGGSNQFIDRLKRLIPKHLYQVLEVLYNFVAFFRLLVAVKTYRPSFIYERFSLYLFAGVAVSKIMRIPLLLEINSPLFEERLSDGDMGFKWLGRVSQRVIWRNSDRLLPVTFVLAKIIQEYDAAAVGRIQVIPNGARNDEFRCPSKAESLKRKLGISKSLVIGFAGFVRSWNAVDRLLTFVEAHGRQNNLHLLIVGDGPARTALEQAAASRGISDLVTITGLVSREEIVSYIDIFDVAVIPGVTPYSSPLKMFEYMDLGRPILAPSSLNIQEILENNNNALLFDNAAADKARDFESCLLRLCADKEFRNQLGRAAKDTIEGRKLTWHDNAIRVVNIATPLIRS